MQNILDDLKYRGLIKDFSNEEEIRELLETKQTIYCGFDPSASSMHVGNYVMISLLMRLQRAGHRVIAVVGGATGMIGDPSGKSKERNLQDANTLLSNTNSIRNQLEKFIDLEDKDKGLLVNNYEWISKIHVLDYLRDYGKYFPINYMLAKDVVASRMEAGISYTEFSYMILQSIDFLHLFDEYGCCIQVGGSDQWGNLTSGLELIHKVKGNEVNAGVMTMNLILRSDGKKFGKSEEGALFLDSKLTSPYKLYQYFMNVSDEDAIRYLKTFTFLSKDEIEEVAREHFASPGARIGQKKLAFEITKDIHGLSKAEEALMMSQVLFSGEITSLTKEQLEEVFGSLMVCSDEELPLIDLLIKINAASSKREAREFIDGNSISINGEKVKDQNLLITKENALFKEYTLIKRGKKNYYLVKHI